MKDKDIAVMYTLGTGVGGGIVINGKAFSCLTCGICHKNCPNGAIFENSYGGYVVDRAKCNGCGMCMYNCPTNNITIEDGIVYGICSRCGVCSEVCSNRIDGYEVEKVKEDKIKELEEELLTSHCGNVWSRLVTANVISHTL